MRQLVEDMRGRPKEDRVAIAIGGALFVGVVLFLVWGYFLLQTIERNAPAPLPPQEIPLFETAALEE